MHVLPSPSAPRFPTAAVGRYVIHTFGCQMNVHDSERMEEILQGAGWIAASSPAETDVILLNTCSVREKAEHKLRSEVGRWLVHKQQHPHTVLAVAGCVAQQEGQRLIKSLPGIDLVLGPDNIPELPLLLQEQLGGAPPRVRTEFDTAQPAFLSAQPVPGHARISAFVTTMKGCDERCSFCVVPYTRGPERYRPAQDILAEVQALVACGTKEVTLLGQTVDSYRDPALPPPASSDPDESQFPTLLRLLVAQTPGLLRLRYTSPHPRHATASLAQAHAELAPLAHHVHLPVQSGSNRILKRMIRRYAREEYLERVERLRAAQPGMTFSTDVIVGFPGETDADFEQTLSLFREVGFTAVFGFQYSIRPYTPARKLTDDVPPTVKQERLQRLLALAEEQTQAYLRSLVHTTQSVLFEGGSKHAAAPAGFQWLQGRSNHNEIVHVLHPTTSSLLGSVQDVVIQKANHYTLQGVLAHASFDLPPLLSSVSARAPRSLPVLG